MCLLATQIGGLASMAQEAPTVPRELLAESRQLAPGAQYVTLSTGVAAMIGQKHGFPAHTYRFPLLDLVVFPNQNLAPDLDAILKSNLIGNIPVNNNFQNPPLLNFNPGLPITDTVQRGMPIGFVRERGRRGSTTGLAYRGQGSGEVSWMVSHKDGSQFIMPGDKEALVFASSGTMFTLAGPRTLALKYGKLWIFNSNRHTSYVVTKLGVVDVKPGSFVGIDQSWFGSVRVANIDGKPSNFRIANKKENANVVITRRTETSFAKAEVASLGTQDYDSANVALTPTVAPANVNVNSADLDLKDSEFVFPLKSLALYYPNASVRGAFSKTLNGLGIALDRSEQNALKAESEKPDPLKLVRYRASTNSRYFVPESKTPSLNDRVYSVQDLRGEPALAGAYLRFFEGTELERDKDIKSQIRLKKGELLVVGGEHTLRIKANDTDVYVKPKAVALVSIQDKTVTVRNLKEMWSKNVAVYTAGRSMPVSSGYEVMVGPDAPEISRIMHADKVLRRQLNHIELLGKERYVSKCEYSLTSLLKNNQLLAQISKSTKESDRKLAANLVKMEACLVLAGGGRGPFRLIGSMPQASM